MKRLVKEVAKVVLVVSVLAIWTLSDVSGVMAQKKASAFEQQIQGGWTLVWPDLLTGYGKIGR